MLRHLRCSSANTASMIGTVTSAVRETTTKAMLTRKLSDSAPNSSAGTIFCSRSNAITGKASTTAHSANSWL